MKTLITAALFASAAASPAFAAKITVEFAPDDGSQAAAWTFDDATMTAVGPDGTEGAYTYDEGAATVCGTDPGGNEVCATFESHNSAPAVGDSMAYTLNTGGGGTATVTGIEE